MLTITEEIHLLVLDYDTGWPNPELPRHAIDTALGGALLMDLALNDRIDTDVGKLFVVNQDLVGEPVLDWALAQINVEDDTRSTDHWVRVFAAERDNLEALLTDMLVERGLVFRGVNEQLWFIGLDGDTEIDGEPFREVKKRIASVPDSDEIPDPRDIMIISLADTCGLCHGLIDASELARLTPKITQIARLDLIGQAVARVMDEGES